MESIFHSELLYRTRTLWGPSYLYAHLDLSLWDGACVLDICYAARITVIFCEPVVHLV